MTCPVAYPGNSTVSSPAMAALTDGFMLYVVEFSVDGQVFFRIMEKYAAEYKKQHGGKIAFS